jgi:hypothetical protein
MQGLEAEATEFLFIESYDSVGSRATGLVLMSLNLAICVRRML